MNIARRAIRICTLATIVGAGGLVLVGAAGAATYNGPGTGTAYELQSGLAVIETTGNISPLDRTQPANLVANGDMTDNGHGNTSPYGFSPLRPSAMNGIQPISAQTPGTPPTKSMPGWTFSGGGAQSYGLWIPGTSAAVGPWPNGLSQWGPHGSKNGASNPQLYFGNSEGWSISPTQANAGFTAQGVTQTPLTWTPGGASSVSNNFVDGLPLTAEQTITTTAGSTYCLSFWIGHEEFGGSGRPDGIARVQIGGYDDVYFKVPTLNGAAGERWYTFQFDARSSSTRLAFSSWGHLGSGGSASTELVLDDVVVNGCAARSSDGGGSNSSSGGSSNASTTSGGSNSSGSSVLSDAPRVAVGDLVWLDINRNGVRDAGEKPLRGVKVTLLNPSGNRAKDASGKVVRVKTTTRGGRFVFDGLKAGAYRIRFLLPSGYRFTVYGKGTAATDSNARAMAANPLGGVTPTFRVYASAKGNTIRNRNGNLAADYLDSTIDAGVVPFAPAFAPSPVTG